VSNEPRVWVHSDVAELERVAASRFLRKLAQAIADFGEATVVLTGGTVGIGVLAAVNADPARDDFPWDRLNVWWGDERWVPKDSPDRNERQARKALLDHVPLDPARIHPFPASDEGLTLDEAADAYAAELLAHAPRGQSLPAFDVTFLGVGPDGHIASLFPESEGIRERERTVVAVRNSPKPPPERLSLTLPVINSSARVVIVLAGADKASVLGLALAGASQIEVPVAGVLGRRRTLFHVDAAGAAEVPQNLIDPGAYWTAADDVTQS